MENELKLIVSVLKKYNQEHILNFFDELTDEEKDKLISQILFIDFKKINDLYEKSNLEDSIDFKRISPLPYISKNNISSNDKKYFSQIGDSILKQGQLAIITLAGGQGTRLGYKGPKGCYEISIPPKISLFEFACMPLKKIYKKFGIYLNWYIMTSPSNDLETKNFFIKHNFFGYPKEKIHFFIQNVFPVIDTNAKILLDNLYTIKTSSNGNGDVFKAFEKSGLMNTLDDNNIKWLSIGSIDNLLLNSTDSLFIGLSEDGNYNIASKSSSKKCMKDSDWIFANVDNRPSIIDSKNIPDNKLYSTNENGDYLYNQKNILSHLFSIKAFKFLSKQSLPYHRAFKKSDFINIEGTKQVPSKENSFKFEKFIFDSFSFFDKLLLLEVPQEEEFAPIKSFRGSETPETALELYKKNNFNIFL